MDKIVSFTNSYVEALTNNSGGVKDGALGRRLDFNEVIRVGPS